MCPLVDSRCCQVGSHSLQSVCLNNDGGGGGAGGGENVNFYLSVCLSVCMSVWGDQRTTY